MKHEATLQLQTALHELAKTRRQEILKRCEKESRECVTEELFVQIAAKLDPCYKRKYGNCGD